MGLNDDVSANPLASPLQSTVYTANIKTKSSSGDTCFIVKTVLLNVSQDTVHVKAGNDTTVCKAALLTLNGSGNINNYIWSSNHSFTDTLNASGVPYAMVYPSTSPSLYFIKAANEFCYDLDSVKIFLSPAAISPGPDQIICLGDSVILSVQNLFPADILSYEWSPQSSILKGGYSTNPLVKPTTNTTYKIVGVNQFGCRDSASINVIVNTPIISNAYADRDSIYEGEFTQLHVQNAGGIKYTWSPPTGLNNIHLPNPIASPSVTTTYQVFVTDANGCVIVTPLTIYVKKLPLCGEPDIFVPNAFSPNGDNVNDKLFVRGNRIQELYFAVFDRWGEKVFETTAQSIGWDGTFKGENAGPAVFDYYLKVKCIGGNEFFKKGNVTIIR